MASGERESTESMDQPQNFEAECSVCSQPLAKSRVHYGGVTCYSCRAFFRRNTQKNCRNGCKFEEKCEINYKDRKACAHCRYEKCIRLGMLPELVLNEDEKKKRFKKAIAKKQQNFGHDEAEEDLDEAESNLVVKEETYDSEGFAENFHLTASPGPESPCQPVGYNPNSIAPAAGCSSNQMQMQLPVSEVLPIIRKMVPLSQITHFNKSVPTQSEPQNNVKLENLLNFYENHESPQNSIAEGFNEYNEQDCNRDTWSTKDQDGSKYFSLPRNPSSFQNSNEAAQRVFLQEQQQKRRSVIMHTSEAFQ